MNLIIYQRQNNKQTTKRLPEILLNFKYCKSPLARRNNKKIKKSTGSSGSLENNVYFLRTSEAGLTVETYLTRAVQILKVAMYLNDNIIAIPYNVGQLCCFCTFCADTFIVVKFVYQHFF